MVALAHHAERVDRAAAGRGVPRELAAEAAGAVSARVEHDGAAVVATLIAQLLVFRRLPERPRVELRFRLGNGRLISAMSVSPQNHGAAAVPAAEHAAVAVRDREPRVLHLRRRFAAQLSRRLDQQKNAAHAGVVRRQAAAVGVQCRAVVRPVEPQPAAGDPAAAFAFRTEAEVLEQRQHGDAERVVDHRDVDFVG